MLNNHRICAILLICILISHVCAVEAAPGATKPTIKAAQTKLALTGYSPGPADGLWGAQTESAIREFQRDNGLEVTGELDESTVEALDIDIEQRFGRVTLFQFSPGIFDDNRREMIVVQNSRVERISVMVEEKGRPFFDGGNMQLLDLVRLSFTSDEFLMAAPDENHQFGVLKYRVNENTPNEIPVGKPIFNNEEVQIEDESAVAELFGELIAAEKLGAVELVVEYIGHNPHDNRTRIPPVRFDFSGVTKALEASKLVSKSVMLDAK